jgi:hypothetical protein
MYDKELRDGVLEATVVYRLPVAARESGWISGGGEKSEKSVELLVNLASTARLRTDMSRDDVERELQRARDELATRLREVLQRLEANEPLPPPKVP